MKNRNSNLLKLPGRVSLAVMVLTFLSISTPSLRADKPGQLFPTAADAAKALGQAASATNRAAFNDIFGPNSDWLTNPDTVQGEREIADFNAAYGTTNRLVSESDKEMTLEVGTNDWPFPIPIVKGDGGWYFDTAAGRTEILNRRIGRDELAALGAVRVYVDAQREYASRDHDNSQVLKYAQKIVSSPGKTDGLYWPPDLNGELSPLGPLLADAQNQGYLGKLSTSDSKPSPFHGYYFKILTSQGKNVPGGKYDYVINGNMIGGFGLVAWPAQYGESGIMTFMVNQQGKVYQKDLGKDTDSIVHKMTAYDPDSSWQVSPE